MDMNNIRSQFPILHQEVNGRPLYIWIVQLHRKNRCLLLNQWKVIIVNTIRMSIEVYIH